MVEFRTLGTLSVRGSDGSELHAFMAGPKRLALLAYLCIAAPRGFHRRDTLLGLFWPESDEVHARAALRKGIHLLRRALGERAIISRGEEEVAVDPDAMWCDAAAFHEHVESGRLEEALALYRGSLLPGFFLDGVPEFERWLERERSQLARLASKTAQRLAGRLESDGRLAEAVGAARTAVALAQTDERTFRQLLELLDRVGDRTGAISAYEGFVQVAADAGVEPSSETQQLVARIRARNTTDPVADASLTGQFVGQTLPLADVTATRELPPPISSIPKAPGRLIKHRLPISLAILAGLAAAIVGTVTLMRPRTSHIPTIAVLPLDNSSRDSADRYFAETMHSELISRLGMIPNIRITSRNSVLRYRDPSTRRRSIANQLGADFLLEGSAGRDSGRVYVSVRLVDARSHRQLWNHSYTETRSVATLFDIQGEIARELADALEVKVSATVRGRIGDRPTESDAAFELYLRASQLDYSSSREANTAAEELLKQALALDPGFPAVLAALGYVYQVRAYTLGGSRALADSGLVLARLALRSDSTLLAGYHALAFGNLELGHLEESREAYQKILALQPSDGYALLVLGWIEFLKGRLAQAVAVWGESQAVDPMSRTLLADMGLVELIFGDFKRARLWQNAANALGPGRGLAGFDSTRLRLAQGKAAEAFVIAERQLARNATSFEARNMAAAAALQAGNLDRARQHLEEIHRTAADDWDFWGTTHRTAYAYVLSKLGERERAQALLDTTMRHALRLIADGDERPGVRREIAAIHAAMGDHEAAFEWLAKAIDAGWRHEALRPSPFFEPLRQTPRFKELMQRMNADIDRAEARVRRENLGPRLPSS